jgi:hypothetical protein
MSNDTQTTAPADASADAAATATSTAVVTRAKVDLPALRAQHEAAVKSVLDRLGAPSSPFIRVTNKKTMVLPNGDERAGPLPFVIVDFVAENRFYSVPFNANNPTPPDCAAVGLAPDDLRPWEDGIDVQNDNCKTCAQNQWNSGPGGRGKACTNARLLALLDPLDEPGAPLLKLRLSPTAITPFESYVRKVSTMLERPLSFVLTYVGFDPASDYATLRFGNPMLLDSEEEFDLGGKKIYGPALIQEAVTRMQEARDMLLAKPEFAPAAAAPAVRAPSRSAASRRATA